MLMLPSPIIPETSILVEKIQEVLKAIIDESLDSWFYAPDEYYHYAQMRSSKMFLGLRSSGCMDVESIMLTQRQAQFLKSFKDALTPSLYFNHPQYGAFDSKLEMLYFSLHQLLSVLKDPMLLNRSPLIINKKLRVGDASICYDAILEACKLSQPHLLQILLSYIPDWSQIKTKVWSRNKDDQWTEIPVNYTMWNQLMLQCAVTMDDIEAQSAHDPHVFLFPIINIALEGQELVNFEAKGWHRSLHREWEDRYLRSEVEALNSASTRVRRL